VATATTARGGIAASVTPLLRAIGCVRRAQRLDASTAQKASAIRCLKWGICSPSYNNNNNNNHHHHRHYATVGLENNNEQRHKNVTSEALEMGGMCDY